MEEIIVLINFNEYQGGGETLLVRYSEYLQKNNIKFLSLCDKKSFIYTELKKRNIDDLNIGVTDIDYNYFYLNELERVNFINCLKEKIGKQSCVRLVTFCLRDLYTAFKLSNQFENCSISHLILHIQDDLYLGQTLLDKFKYKIFQVRQFSGKINIDLNRKLLKKVNEKTGLICMAEIINNFWHQSFQIVVPNSHVVPLPSFVALKDVNYKTRNEKKIIWIGRFVDFKIPSIVSMIEFVSNNKDYSLTIVGDGNKKKILEYVKKNSLDVSRVNFIGEVPYHNLGAVIKNHSIGYGMGTSLIELAQYKLPVLIALASYTHEFFNRSICGGLFYNKAKGCDGSDLMLISPNDVKTTIKIAIEEIESDYLKTAEACYDFAKENYSENTNFKLYTDIIMNTKVLSKEDKQIKIPYSSSVRRFLFNKYMKA